jgi:threonine/homoserine/homoserine lactone efflux protein
MAFFPLFVDPARPAGVATFAAMAATIAALTFLYGAIVTVLTHRLAERMRADPRIGRLFGRAAGVFMIGFGVKLALSR